MNISLDNILEFHYLRTQCHIDCVNYFADILGYHFPEHDNDKNSGIVRDGYAYWNWVSYPPNAKLTQVQMDLFNMAHNEHHRMQPHHIDYYKNAYKFESVMDFFNKVMTYFNWTDAQRKSIADYVATIHEKPLTMIL